MAPFSSEAEYSSELIPSFVESAVLPPGLKRGNEADIFRGNVTSQLDTINASRKKQAVPKLNIDQARIIFHAAVLAAGLTVKARKSGEPAFNHFRGASEIATDVLGLNDEDEVAQAYAHDAKEDAGIDTFEKFEEAWAATFSQGKNDSLFIESKKTRRRVWDVVRGLSKDPKDPTRTDRAEEKRERNYMAIRKLFQLWIDLGPGPLLVKAADRLHNMRTLEHHEEARRIADETFEVYAQTLHLLAADEFVSEVVDLCATFLNQNLLQEFKALVDLNIKKRLDEHMVSADRLKLINTEQGLALPGQDPLALREEKPQDVKKISVRQYLDLVLSPKRKSEQNRKIVDRCVSFGVSPFMLADFSLEQDKKIKELSIDDLSLGESPLFEVRVLVEKPEDVEEMKNYLLKCFKRPGEQRTVTEIDPQGPPQRGLRIAIFSEEFGLLQFRVNDAISEERSKRGVLDVRLPDLENGRDNMDPTTREALKRILRETSKHPAKTIERARELLLKPKVRIITPDNEVYNLPRGSTALDFARAVHTDLFRNFVGAVEQRTNMIREGRRAGAIMIEEIPINPLEPLREGMRVRILTSESSPIQHGPEHYHFADGERTKINLKEILCKENTGTNKRHSEKPDENIDDAVVARAQKYIAGLSELFGLNEEQIYAPLRQVWPSDKYSMRQLCAGICSGEIDPLKILSEGVFNYTNAWPIEVELEHAPGILHTFLSIFKNEKINVGGLLHEENAKSKLQVVRMTLKDNTGKKTAFDMIIVILKLSLEYKSLHIQI